MKKKLFFSVLLGAALNINAQTVIFEETFETSNSTTGALPTGWTTEDRDSDGLVWRGRNLSALTNPMGFSGATASNFANVLSDDLLISPSVNLQTGNSYSLTFQVGTFSSGSWGSESHYAVYILPEAATFTGTEMPVLEETTSVGNIAILKTIDLAAYAGQNIKIYFRQFENPDVSMFFIDTVKIIQQSTLNTSETSIKQQISLYPNPTSDYIYLKSKITKADIFDVTGRKVNVVVSDHKVDVQDLQPGTYLIKITTENKTYFQKFIKK